MSRWCAAAWVSALLGGMGSAGVVAGERPSVATDAVAPGTFAWAPDPYSAPPLDASVLMLVREPAGRLRVWFFLQRDGVPRLPADAQWRAGPPCGRFELDAAADELACRDADLPPSIAARYRWHLDGRRRTEFVPDLLRVPGAERGGRYVLHAPGNDR